MRRLLLAAVVLMLCITDARARASNCPANTQCVENARTGATYTGSGFIHAAIVAARSGDTLTFQWPAPTYTQHDIQITTTLTLNLNGATFDPSLNFVAGKPGTGTVAQGVFLSGAVGAPANLTIENGTLQDITQSWNTSTTTGKYCNGITIAPGAPMQCGGGCNSGGVWYMGGNLRMVNIRVFHACNGLVGNAPIYSTGSIYIENSVFAEDGQGDGQSHCVYAGQVYSVTIIGSIATKCINGHGFKARGIVNVLQGNSSGDGQPDPAPIGTIAGNTDPYGTSNEINLGDGGKTTLSGNVLYKDATASNPFFIEYGGQVAPHVGSQFTETGDTFVFANGYRGEANQALVWNWFDGVPFSVTNSTIKGSPVSTIFLLGEGTQSGNGSFPATTPISYPIITGGPLSPLLNFQGTGTPHSVTMSGNQEGVLGGSGRLTVDLPTRGLPGGEVFAGPGGATIVAQSGGSNVNFMDSLGDAPSTYTGQSVIIVDARADGDVINAEGQSGGYFDLEGRNQTLNAIGTAKMTSYIYLASGTKGIMPAATINYDPQPIGGANIMAGGDLTINGTGSTVPNLNVSAAPGVALAPGCVNVNLTEVSGLLCGQFTGNTLYFYDYSDPSTHSWFNPTGSAKWVFALENGTVYYGNSTAASAGSAGNINFTAANYAALRTAATVGSGAGQYGPGYGVPGLIEVAQGFGGGKLNVANVTPSVAAITPIVFLGGAAKAGCSSSRGTATITASDGSTIRLSAAVDCASLNFTPPAAWNDATLTGANITGQTGQTVAAPMTLTDAMARTLSGYEMVTVWDSAGRIGLSCPGCIFNVDGTITYGGSATAARIGGFVSMMGDEVSIERALASMTDTLGGSGTISVQEWNEGGFERTLTVMVTRSNAARSDIPTGHRAPRRHL